ncbi:MAG: rRNA maturation RNase YbeY [Anaerolineaceae bacterium]|nr:rRNA maturation RNase YbeY [Anaerolineaceae bacterium]
MSGVCVRNESGHDLDTALLIEAVRATLRMHGDKKSPDGRVSIVLTSDERVRNLNRRYRGIDRVTDILSFPAVPHGIGEEEPDLGDLVLATPWASRQADRVGHQLMDDLALLVVHGTLHLLGFTHDDDRGSDAMRAAQDAVLQGLGVPPENAEHLEQLSETEVWA